MSDAAETLAGALVAADETARAALWPQADALEPQALAWALKARIDAAWNSEPHAVPRIAAVLAELAQRCGDGTALALAAWAHGIAFLTRGEMVAALPQLEDAAARFAALGQRLEMARMRVSQVMALAMLGRYDEAIECGISARDVFVAAGDALSAGKVELNLGNLALRRDRYEAAARHYRAAAERFEACGEREHLAVATKGLADTLARQHDFDAATALYEAALARAQDNGLAVLVAAIEGDIGELELLRGRFDRALHFLERARRGCEALAEPARLAFAEERQGDAYLELRLLPEALAVYERALATYEIAGLQADRARVLAQRGRTLASMRDFTAARSSLERARQLFVAEGNQVGAALARLWLAELALAQSDADAAVREGRTAQGPLAAARHMSGYLGARALLAEALRLAGKRDAAAEAAQQAHADAASIGLPQVQRRCALTLGLLAREADRPDEAESHFRAVVAQIESQRGTLPGEEFRSAFFADHQRAYDELARLALARGDARAAFAWIEQARARALADAMRDETAAGEDEAPQSREIARLRLRLNACYRRLARPDGQDAAALHDEVRRLEAALAEAGRRAQLLAAGERCGQAAAPIDLQALADALGGHTALVEYFALDDELHAFVVSDGGVVAQPLAAAETEVRTAIERLRFQLDTLRHGSARLQHRLPELRARALFHLRRLYDALWAPLLPHLGRRRAAIVPHASLHYLPFEALFDGAAHEVERRELTRAASARVLLQCLARAAPRFDSALLLGYADARLPYVARELDAVAARFEAVVRLDGAEAKAAALRSFGAAADVLHVACHGLFRGDNPRFSALQLADGALTARDAARLRLSCGLAALSACESGVAHVLAGNEPIGLTQSFLSAGAASVLASAWTVQDEAAAEFMAEFYERLRRHRAPARALREAQCAMLARRPHPYYWAAFALHGRW